MTPLILYNSAGLPVGPRAIVQIQRPTYSDDTSPNYAAGVTKPKVADIIAFGGSGTAIGDPVEIAGLSLSFNGNPNMTTGVIGQSNNDPSVVRGEPTLNIETFIKTAATPTPLPGDFIDLYCAVKPAGGNVPISRWVFTSTSIATSGSNKFSGSLILDRENSDPALAEF
jgi:hypothetical protein